jgi:FPC/CPF motif-containing protein YcgG
MDSQKQIKNEYLNYIKNVNFPCVAAKSALIYGQLKIMVADHMACPRDDKKILEFLYKFVDFYRGSNEIFHSAAVIFKQPDLLGEEQFENLMWRKLQSLSSQDAQNYNYDSRVDCDVGSNKFSFSLKEEAFFIIGLHPKSSRISRRFKYPALVFNPHQQFETLRQKNCFDKIKNVIRQRDKKISGDVNHMLQDYGLVSEAAQYSGRQHNEEWQCPLKINHRKN